MLYEVVLEQRYFNQQVINRWNYNSSGVPATVQGSFALAFAMGFIPDGTPPDYPADSIFAAMREIQGTALIYNQITVKAIYDVVDFYAAPFPTGTTGESTGGESVSPVDALGMRSTRVRTDISRGYKRFAGAVEGAFTEGGIVGSDMLTALNQLGGRMAETIEYIDEGSTLSFVPCIVSKEKYTTPSGKFAYRYYASQATQLTHIATGIGWEPYTQQRTQRSRQYGKGA